MSHSPFPEFKTPPNNFSVEEVFDLHLQVNADHPVFIHPVKGQEDRCYTYAEVVPAIHRAGYLVADSIGFNPEDESQPTPVVALLCRADTLTYLTVLVGLLRAGMTAFPISPRFASSVISYLLETAKAKFLLVNCSTMPLAVHALDELSKTSCPAPVLCDFPQYRVLYPGINNYTPLAKHRRRPEEPAFLIHSSSSSSLYPKVIPWTSNFIWRNTEIIDHAVQKPGGKIFGCPGLELFHSAGICFIFWMVRTGFLMGTIDPQDRASVLPCDMDTVFQNLELTRPSLLFASPRALEVWSDDPHKVNMLRNSIVVTGGRFLSKAAGDKLVAEGVSINVAFGSTETGVISFLSEPQGTYWEYWTPAPARPEAKFIAREDGMYELVVLASEENPLPVCNTVWNDNPAYNPGDIFLAHPTKPDTYRIFGRISDQIMLASGEMVNPNPIEDAISQHRGVSAAVMFGHSRASLGLILDTNPKHTTDETRERFLSNLWPFIESINENLPPHSRLARDRVVFATNDRPFPYTPKGLPRRPVIWHAYEPEIDAIYRQKFQIHSK